MKFNSWQVTILGVSLLGATSFLVWSGKLPPAAVSAPIMAFVAWLVPSPLNKVVIPVTLEEPPK